MNKQEFLDLLAAELSGLPEEDKKEQLEFYSEMIDDRIEDGTNEEDAVASFGDPKEVASSVLAEIPLTRIVKEKLKKEKKERTRKYSAFSIVLIAVGSVVWFPILVSLLAVCLALYVVFWAVIISLWSVFVSLAASALGVLFGGIVFIARGYLLCGLACIGAALICAGLSIFAFAGCKAATKGGAKLTKKLALAIKRTLVRKEKEE